MKEKICSGCGRKGPLWRSKPPLCALCVKKTGIPGKKPKPHISISRHHKPINSNRNKPVAKISPKKQEHITLSKQYYLEAITANIFKNKGVCLCDECNERISHPKGRNCAHIVGSGANPTLYFDKRNHFILGKGPIFNECDCLWKFDESGEKETMKIYPRYVEIRETLNREYYTGGATNL